MDDAEFTEFEWDDAKSQRTKGERGIGFEEASYIFDGAYIEWEDSRENYGERRFIAVGKVEGIFLTAVWTPRPPVRRIIAVWPSSRQERRLYHEHYPKEGE